MSVSTSPSPPVGRLAPTPSGHLHLGNALAFGAAWLSARQAGGRLVLRFEDVDEGRARAEIEASQRDDLRWLGLDWDEELPRQSSRTYPLGALPTYRCDCNRAQRLAGACRCRGEEKSEGRVCAALPKGQVSFEERALGRCVGVPDGDPVLLQASGAATYTLAVVLDDLRDGVTEVVRGADLLDATPTQVALYGLLGEAPPTYLHVPMLLGPDGKKLSKSHGSAELRALRARGIPPEAVWAQLLPLLGAPPGPIAAALRNTAAPLDPAAVLRGPFRVDEVGRLVPMGAGGG